MIIRLTTALVLTLTLAVTPTSAQEGDQWRTVAAENLWIIETRHGQILVALAPEVAPAAVERIRVLTRQGFYDGLLFHRVISGFMAQGGDPLGTGAGSSDLPDLPGEFQFRRGRDQGFAPVQGVAGQGYFGFYGALPVQTQPDAQMFVTADNRVDAVGQFCPGVVGMARSAQPDSANSQFFLMTGSQPRLNGQYTAVGVIVSDLSVVRAIKLGTGDDGQVTDPDAMLRARMASDIPESERPTVRILDPRSPSFADVIAAARAEKGARLTLCDIQAPTEVS